MKATADIIIARIDELGRTHRVSARTKEAARVIRVHGLISGAVVENELLKAVATDARQHGLKIRHEIES